MITTGINKVMNVTFFNPLSENTAIMNPINSEPVSPKKILAGWKLCGKKPTKANTKAKIQIAT